MRVIICDDNKDHASTLEAMMRFEGHDPTVCNDGRRCIAAAFECKPQAALLDLAMPGIDGFEIAAALRRSLGRGVLIIAITGYGSEDYRRRAKEAGFDLYFLKPADANTIVAALNHRSGPRT